MKKHLLATALLTSIMAVSVPASAQPVWKRVVPDTGSGGGGSTACSFIMNRPFLDRMVPVDTTLQYYMIGGGGGGNDSMPGGQGGNTYIMVNGVIQASAAGGASNSNGTLSQGNIVLNKGELITIRLGGGGGGGGANTSGKDAVEGPSGSESDSGDGKGGGGGGWGSGGGTGEGSSTQNDGDSWGASFGQGGNNSLGVLSTRPGFGQSGRGGNNPTGGSAGAADFTYESSGCWLN